MSTLIFTELFHKHYYLPPPGVQETLLKRCYSNQILLQKWSIYFQFGFEMYLKKSSSDIIFGKDDSEQKLLH